MSSDRRDQGLTLTELIIVVAVIGIVMTSLSAAIVVFLRNEGSVSTRLTESRDLQNLANYIPGDVASARVIETETTGLAEESNACGTGGSIVLHLEWAEEWAGSNYVNHVTYRRFPSPESRLVRFECENGLPRPQTVVARAFSDAAVNIALDSSGRQTGTIEVVLTYSTEFKRITATSRNYLP